MAEIRSARLADIAAQADVSEATVSRVLNDRPGVADATRRAVLTAIDVLGYDRPARLRPKSALLVGLVMPELVNPIFPAFAQVIETALAAEGFTPALCTPTPGVLPGPEDDAGDAPINAHLQVVGLVHPAGGLGAQHRGDPLRRAPGSV